MSQESRPTLRDVARRAAVSKSTASRVLNDHANVTNDAREAVLKAVAEVGYVPNQSARSLKTNRTLTLGLVVTRIRNEVFAGIAQGMSQGLTELGWTLIVGTSNDRPEQEARLIASLGPRVDGIAVSVVDERSAETKRVLRGLRIPILLLDREIAGLDADQLVSDHSAGIGASMSDLREHGHDAIGLIAPPTHVRAGREVARVFLDHGGREEMIRTGSLTEEFGQRAATSLLDGSTRPSALIVSGTEVLAGVLGVFRDRRLRVPADISLVAYDESPAARFHDPGINALARDPERIGAMAAELLRRRIDGSQGPPRRTVLPTVYVPRGSVRRLG